MVNSQANDLDQIFHALADSTRRDILSRLDSGSSAVKPLAKSYGMSLPAVMKHVKVLEQAGLVATTKEGRVRQVVARPENLKDAGEWVRHYERYWSDALDRLVAFVEQEEE